MNAEALFERKKWFSARNQYLDNCNVKWMNQFGHHVDEEEDRDIEDEK